jgi:ketosteroid isomerase-like protein
MQDAHSEIVAATEALLDAVGRQDWTGYVALSDPELTAFEPEARGSLVKGLGFHQTYFEARGDVAAVRQTVCDPDVRMLGPDSALIAYVRLVQSYDPERGHRTDRFEETRVWQRGADGWRQIHFHRSTPE